MLFLAALDKLTREELLDLTTVYQTLGLWVGVKEAIFSGFRWLGFSERRPLEEELKRVRQELEDLTDQGLRRRLYKAIADLAGVKEEDRADPEKVAHQALLAAATHLGVSTEMLSPAEVEARVCEKSIEKLIQQLESRLQKLSPEEEARLEEHLREILEKMSAGDQEAIRQALGMEKLTSEALLGVLKTGTLTLGPLVALNLAGFGVYLAAATGLKAMALLLGIALPFKAYLATSAALGIILGPVGVLFAFGLMSLVSYSQKTKFDREILCQLITALHYRLVRE